MAKFKDITDQRFGRLAILHRVENDSKGNTKWLCQCDCGNRTTVKAYTLISGHTKSCGCLHKEILLIANVKHGLKHSPEYNCWCNMMQRCYNKNNSGFIYYGARGIKVDKRWHLFSNFIIDMGHKPDLGYTIERIDNNGDYELGNCKWATQKEQGRNKRNTHWITFNDQTKSLVEWSEILGVHHDVLYSRLNKYKWSVEIALIEPLHYTRGRSA